MGRTGARDSSLNYYPPRARWHTRIAFSAAKRLRHYLHLEGLHLPDRVSLGQLVLSVAPAYSFFAGGRRLLGWISLAAYCSAVLVFLVGLGYASGNIAYGLMISIHATGIVFLEGLWLKDPGLGARLGVAFCTLIAVWGLIYRPVVRLAEQHWLMPVRIGDRVLVVNRTVAPESIKRGDWVAYEITAQSAASASWGRVYLSAGLGVDRALALPGDRVRFTGEALWVNDKPLLRPRYMPGAGEFLVPEKVWFIWPNLAITVRGVAEGDVSAAIQHVAMVTREQIIGTPFKRWFWRRQVLP